MSLDTALNGAESKDPEDAYLAYAVRSFSTTETRVQDLAGVPTWWSRVHLLAPPAFEFVPVRAAEDVDVAAGHGKMLAVLVLGPRERPWPVRPVPASVVEKLRTASAR